MNNDGFSDSTRNGKQIRGDDVHEPVSNWTRIEKQIKSSGIVETTLHTNLTIIDRKRPVKVFATTYGPNVDIYCIKYDLEDKLT